MSSKKDRLKERVIGLHEKGCTPVTISKSVGDAATCSIRMWLREWGFEPNAGTMGRPQGARTAVVPKARANFGPHEQTIFNYHEAGLTPKEIHAEMEGVIDTSVDTFRSYLKRHGKTPNRA